MLTTTNEKTEPFFDTSYLQEQLGGDLAKYARLLKGGGVGATWRSKQAYLKGAEWKRLGEVSRATYRRQLGAFGEVSRPT